MFGQFISLREKKTKLFEPRVNVRYGVQFYNSHRSISKATDMSAFSTGSTSYKIYHTFSKHFLLRFRWSIVLNEKRRIVTHKLDKFSIAFNEL